MSHSHSPVAESVDTPSWTGDGAWIFYDNRICTQLRIDVKRNTFKCSGVVGLESEFWERDYCKVNWIGCKLAEDMWRYPYQIPVFGSTSFSGLAL